VANNNDSIINNYAQYGVCVCHKMHHAPCCKVCQIRRGVTTTDCWRACCWQPCRAHGVLAPPATARRASLRAAASAPRSAAQATSRSQRGCSGGTAVGRLASSRSTNENTATSDGSGACGSYSTEWLMSHGLFKRAMLNKDTRRTSKTTPHHRRPPGPHCSNHL
jgi:hypothetical protein